MLQALLFVQELIRYQNLAKSLLADGIRIVTRALVI